MKEERFKTSAMTSSGGGSAQKRRTHANASEKHTQKQKEETSCEKLCVCVPPSTKSFFS